MSRQDHEHDQLQERIIEHLRSEQYRPLRPRRLARQLNVAGEEHYPAFREALRELMRQGRVVLGAGGDVVLPTQRSGRDEFTGTYRHNRRGFGFVVPLDPEAHEDLYIPPGENNGALTGDVVRARITSRGQRDGRTIYTGRVTEIVQRTNKRFAGTLVRIAGQWAVHPDGNTLTEPILTPDAASRHIRPGTKVVVELTSYPQEPGQWPQGVITEVLGRAGDKDVDLKSVIVQFNRSMSRRSVVAGSILPIRSSAPSTPTTPRTSTTPSASDRSSTGTGNWACTSPTYRSSSNRLRRWIRKPNSAATARTFPAT